MDERIAEAIQSVIDEGTFTPAALKRMNATLERVKTLENKSAQDEREIRDLRNQIIRLEREAIATKKEIERYEAREQTIKQAEADQAKLEREKAVAQARADTFSTCFSTVFRNTEIRRKVFSNDGVFIQDQYGGGMQHMTNSNKDITEQAE